MVKCHTLEWQSNVACPVDQRKVLRKVLHPYVVEFCAVDKIITVLEIKKIINRIFNSHGTSGEKCVEIVKTLHVKFFPFGSLLPSRAVTVKCSVSPSPD